MAFQCLQIKSNPQHDCASCRLGEFCALNGIEYHVCCSAYEGLAWLRKHKAEIIVITLPCADVLWSSFRSTAFAISPSSYIVTVCDKPTTPEGSGAEPWELYHGFTRNSEERTVKIFSEAGEGCQVAECVCDLLMREFHAVSPLLPSRQGATTATPLLANVGAGKGETDPGQSENEPQADLANTAQGHVLTEADASERGDDSRESQRGALELNANTELETAKSAAPNEAVAGYDAPLLFEAFSQKSDLLAASSFSNIDSAALQSYCRQQSELLRYWESQWNALLQMLGVGLQIGSSSRVLADSLQIINGFAEILLADSSLPEQAHSMLKEIKERAQESSNNLNNIDEALHMGHSVPLSYVSPRLLIFDVLQKMSRQHGQCQETRSQADGKDIYQFGHYIVSIHRDMANYTLLTDRRQFSTFILNLFLWAESNREVWRQFRARMMSLAGKYDSVADDEENLELEVSVTADSRLHLRIFDSCGMVWPLELLGTPENPGPLYTSITFVWPGTQVPMWGLALVRAFAALHQGQVEVTNADEGVYLDVELTGRISQEQIKESLWSREEASRSLGSVLFVEDDEKGVRESVFALRKAGFDVLVCDRADRAMEAVQHNDFDLMVLDLNLPDMNGMDLYRELVGMCPALDQRAVFVTGFLGTGFFIDSELRRFFAENHCLYLAKPYSSTELLRSVKATLSKRVAPARQKLSERVL